MPDHCHLLVGLNPQKSTADLVRDVKSGSSKWVNDQQLYYGKFAWQTGYGAFSYARSQLEAVVQYIINQPQHHQRRTFREEYMAILEKFDVQYDTKYVFEFF